MPASDRWKTCARCAKRKTLSQFPRLRAGSDERGPVRRQCRRDARDADGITAERRRR